jgi:AcrR family transcriptional regulator
VPRPKVPLISKRKTLEAALKIIDEEGLDALSVRRLADELNVNAASLYHHFSNKDEILAGAAKLALEDVRTPETRDEDWRIWIARNGDRLRSALVTHPDLIPIMMRRELLGIGVAELDATAGVLEEEGVPLGAIAPILEYGEVLAIVCALAETENESGRPVPSAEYPHLRKAALKRATSIDRVFARAYAAGVEAIIEEVDAASGRGGGQRQTPAQKPARRPAVAGSSSAKSARRG